MTSLLRDRHWLPVKQRVEYKLCMMVHRCLYGDAPSYLADLITPSAAATVRPGRRSAASNTVPVPRTTSSLGERSFAAAGPRAWNKLPPPLRRVYSAATFKRQFQTFLYNHAFCARRLSVERYSYSDVAGWLGGWLGGWVAGWVSVTLRYCIKTAKPIGKLFRPSESPIILVF